MTSAFITALDGSLVSVGNVTKVRPVTGRSDLAISRSEFVLADNSRVVADTSFLDNDGPLADWPQVEGNIRHNPATVTRIEDGVAFDRQGKNLGHVTNLDHLQKLSRVASQPVSGAPRTRRHSA